MRETSGILWKLPLIFVVFLTTPLNVLFADVYDDLFPESEKSMYHDTMFEKIIWHKKVSNLVMETVNGEYYVTMLVSPQTPYNFKSSTYPLHYTFKSYDEAYKKFIWLDNFLKSGRILKVRISGNRILNETILDAP